LRESKQSPRRPACSSHGQYIPVHGEAPQGSRSPRGHVSAERAARSPTGRGSDGSIVMACRRDEGRGRWRPASSSGRSAAGPRGAQALSVTHVSGRPPRPTTASDPPWLPMTWWGAPSLAFPVLDLLRHRYPVVGPQGSPW
jgi:hypothetical protein